MPPLYIILCGSRSALQPDGVVHHHGPGIGQLQVVAQLHRRQLLADVVHRHANCRDIS